MPPTPTFTPSPSPTPVFHYVVEGDTLFGIAIQYGITVEALTYANSIAVDDYLRIGQALIIPLEVPDPQAEMEIIEPVGNLILPTPTPQPLEIVGVSLATTAVGGLRCMGEVRNTLAEPVTNLQIQAALVDAAGNPIVTNTALAPVDYLPAGKAAPFSILFSDPPPGIADVRVALLRGETLSAITAGFTPLAVSAVEGSVSGPQYRVAGSVMNDAGVAVERVTVVITLYDQAERVIGYRQAVLENGRQVAAGESLGFSLLITPQGIEEPGSFQVLVWGTRIG